MCNFKNIALLSVLAFSGMALAVDSTSTGFGTAETTTTATGTYASKVAFTIPTAILTIPSAQVRPGATFTITIPVTNTTDRAITVTAGTVTKPDNVTVTVTTSTATIDAGAVGSLVYTLAFDADSVGGAALTGAANFSFKMAAADTVAAPQPLSY